MKGFDGDAIEVRLHWILGFEGSAPDAGHGSAINLRM